MGFPKLSVPHNDKTVCQTPKSFRGARMCLRSSITMPSLVRRGVHMLPEQPKIPSFLFVCLCVCVSVTLLNDIDCVHDFGMKLLENRNNH